MKTKITFILSLILLTSLTLSACNFMEGYGQEAGANGKPAPRFKNARGGEVWSCKGDILQPSGGIIT
ncbi:hypothetical protein LP090_01835 [Moraxella bovis]|uniref:hypothetical protein n=1 Tax=Moraxella bovis TaxID=476 RepID=UPI002226DD55|nr:hypothetical protein [Moraxella bovis]UYZ68211.1 hypothetical protein LP122_10705 [Moraxella bovis]UYZ70594.1 hypothetical protein LP089_10855 [Moraxella bovis]UYZ73486.1 hypothetical protein LP105_01820 [Moraxella bovis]UZA13891.1 hypothetical protein LP102_10895 [Moraxella bovis]UZA27752.1 hypothetical protein LP119_01850 [Moraxella bovis]